MTMVGFWDVALRTSTCSSAPRTMASGPSPQCSITVRSTYFSARMKPSREPR
jgi:hypothetical protein